MSPVGAAESVCGMPWRFTDIYTTKNKSQMEKLLANLRDFYTGLSILLVLIVAAILRVDLSEDYEDEY